MDNENHNIPQKLLLPLSVQRSKNDYNIYTRIQKFTHRHGHPPDENSTLLEWADISDDFDFLRDLNYVQGLEHLKFCVQTRACRRILPIFERMHPEDDRPRKAIECLENWLVSPESVCKWEMRKIKDRAAWASDEAQNAERKWQKNAEYYLSEYFDARSDMRQAQRIYADLRDKAEESAISGRGDYAVVCKEKGISGTNGDVYEIVRFREHQIIDIEVEQSQSFVKKSRNAVDYAYDKYEKTHDKGRHYSAAHHASSAIFWTIAYAVMGHRNDYNEVRRLIYEAIKATLPKSYSTCAAVVEEAKKQRSDAMELLKNQYILDARTGTG